MYISKLSLTNFRNYEQRSFEFNENTTIITGDNGVGKTNIIEAVVFMSAMRSHRTSQDCDMIMFNKPYSVLMGEFTTNNGNEKINILINSDGTKKIKYNNQEVKRLGDVVGKLNTVIFSPDEMDIIKEGPDKRRKFLDVAISKIDREYFNSLQLYKKIIRQKNKLLKHFEGPDRYEVLDTYNEMLAKNGAYIEFRRRFFIDHLNDMIERIYVLLTGKRDEVYIELVSHIDSDGDCEQIEENYTNILNEIKNVEIEKRCAVKGVHVDDLTFYVNRHNAKKFCSQGQQRILLLSVLFAQTEIAFSETGDAPIVLLDDILSELDCERKKLVLDYLSNYQVLITTANEEASLTSYINDCTIMEIK